MNVCQQFEFDLSDLESDLNEVMLRLLNAQDFYSQLVGNVSSELNTWLVLLLILYKLIYFFSIQE